MQAESFFALTIEKVLEAADHSAVKTTGHCLQLASLENRVYDLKLEDGSHIIAKFYRPGRWSKKQILEEHSFLFELAEQEIPVVCPIRFDDGNTIHSTENILYSIFPRVGGRAPDEFNDEQLLQLGRFVARLHNSGSTQAYRFRSQLNAETYIHNPYAFLNNQDLIPEQYKDLYSSCIKKLTDIYESLSAYVPLIRIHGDCHRGNLLYGDEGYFFIDFDDTLMGPAVQDLWLLIPERDEDGLYQRQIFLEGYRQFRDFDDSWLKLIEPLRAMRYIHYCAWQARRKDDPAFVAAFPDLHSEQYWADQCNDLSEQIQYIETNDENYIAPEQQEELTNADFFWDWED